MSVIGVYIYVFNMVTVAFTLPYILTSFWGYSHA